MKKLLLIAFLSLFNFSIQAQLSAGDIAFIGFNEDSGPGAGQDHSFSFITLTDIPASEVIYFTDEGWDDDANDWVGNTEVHLIWTAPGGGISCGTVIYITESSPEGFTITGGGTISLASGSGWNFSGGDSVLAYQAATPEPATTPTFLAGILTDDGGAGPGINPTTKWNDTAPYGGASSGLPAGLTNGVNCVSLFPAALTERDNSKYTGTLTGTSTSLRALINDRTNWSNDNSTPFDITPTGYAPSVTCVPPATAPTVTTTDAASIATTSATLAGNVTVDGGETVTERGIVYSITSTNANPLIGGTGVIKDTNGGGTGFFSETISGLTSSTAYSFKAYAINSEGTSYGAVKTFTTANTPPTVTTTAASNIAGTFVDLAGNVTSDGGTTVTERGIVYAVTSTNANPIIGGTGVIQNDNGSGTGIFSETISSLTLSTNYSFKAYAINAEGTSYGAAQTFTTLANDTNTYTASSGNWNEPTNWSLGRNPIITDNIDINDKTINLNISGVTVNNLSISVGGTFNILSGNSLTIEGNLTQNGTFNILSSATANGSLILKGNQSGIGNVSFLRYLTTNWHLISSPVDGQNISDFSGSVETNGNNYAIAPYKNNVISDNRWNYFTADASNPIASAGFFEASKGYSIKKKTVAGTITLSGTLYTVDKSIPILDGGDDPAGNRWNLIGNPFTAAINASNAAHATNNFLKVNIDAGNLDPSRAGLYLWDGGPSYAEKSIDDAAFYIAPGQAFFVHAPDGGGTSASFTEVMQNHQTGDIFLKSSTNYPEAILQISDGNNNSSTKIRYIKNKTTGLDVGSDIGTFTGASSNFKVFTHLLSNNIGVDFAIQALPDNNYENMIIPIGLYTEAGKEITFSLNTVNFNSEMNIFLEDRKTNTFTRLNDINSSYTVTITKKTNGIGRFYLHTTESTLNTNKELDLESINIYKLDKSTLRITGLFQKNTSFRLFNILGKQVLNTSFQSNGVKDIKLPKLSKGIYHVMIQTEKGKLNKKIILE